MTNHKTADRMEKRPRIKLELTATDKVFELIGWLSIVAIWWLTLAAYGDLPDTIPIHYDGTGQADRFGGKENILILPVVATVLFVGLTILNRFPHMFNYPRSITKENALAQYTNATRTIRYLKLALVIVFGIIAFRAIRYSGEEVYGSGAWLLPLILVLIFLPLVYFAAKPMKAKQ